MLSHARSLLYVPADRPDRFQRAASSGADITILDLEDSVLPGNKEGARTAVAEFLSTHDTTEVAVRVNQGLLSPDFDAIGRFATMLVLPDVSASGLTVLEQAWRDHVGGSRVPRVLGLIESAQGLADLRQVVSHPWISRLGLGEADLAADMGLLPDDVRTELWPFRAMVVMHSRVGQLPAPVGAVFTRLSDLHELTRTTKLQRMQGFRGRTAIHPQQISTINRIYTASRQDLERARRVLGEFDEATRSGSGVVRGSSGELLDPATIRWAKQLISDERAQGGD